MGTCRPSARHGRAGVPGAAILLAAALLTSGIFRWTTRRAPSPRGQLHPGGRPRPGTAAAPLGPAGLHRRLHIGACLGGRLALQESTCNGHLRGMAPPPRVDSVLPRHTPDRTPKGITMRELVRLRATGKQDESAGPPALDGVNPTIQAGEATAVTGPSGSGTSSCATRSRSGPAHRGPGRDGPGPVHDDLSDRR